RAGAARCGSGCLRCEPPPPPPPPLSRDGRATGCRARPPPVPPLRAVPPTAVASLCWLHIVVPYAAFLRSMCSVPERPSLGRQLSSPARHWRVIRPDGDRRWSTSRGPRPPFGARHAKARTCSVRAMVSSGVRHKNARHSFSLPYPTYSAPGGLWQGPGRDAESSTEATARGKRSHDVRLLSSTYRGGRPVVGGTGHRTGHRLVTGCPTRGSTESEIPMIRSVGAVLRNMAASEAAR
ncbi:hypothetical protein GA0115239_109430, partial [Streptomyces sp. BpilaLS-43]